MNDLNNDFNQFDISLDGDLLNDSELIELNLGADIFNESQYSISSDPLFSDTSDSMQDNLLGDDSLIDGTAHSTDNYWESDDHLTRVNSYILPESFDLSNPSNNYWANDTLNDNSLPDEIEVSDYNRLNNHPSTRFMSSHTPNARVASCSTTNATPSITIQDDVIYRENLDGTTTKLGYVTHSATRHYLYDIKPNGSRGDMVCNIDQDGVIYHEDWRTSQKMGHVNNGKVYNSKGNLIENCDSNVEGAAHLFFIGK